MICADTVFYTHRGQVFETPPSFFFSLEEHPAAEVCMDTARLHWGHAASVLATHTDRLPIPTPYAELCVRF